MNVSEYIFDYLNKKGVDTAFMVTGGQAMWLNDAIGKNGNYKIICTHHEQSAAMSADAYSRITNKPAIALVTAGPGSINALTGVVGGWTDSAPMIIISGQANLSFVQYQDKTQIRQYGVQGINIKPIVENVVKFFVTVDDVTMIKYFLDKAYHEATTGRPGPVWIDVPLDIQKTAVNERFLKEYRSNENTDKIALVNAVNIAYEKLKTSDRPILLVGQGVKLSGAKALFNELAHDIKVPVITARLGIDIIESDDELYVGRPGNYGERAANLAIQNSDLIISMGCRLSSSLVGHSPKQFGKNAFIFVVDIDKEELNKPGPKVDYKYNGDCKEFILELKNKCHEQNIGSFRAWIDKCNEWKQKYPVALPEYENEKPVNSYLFISELSKLIDKGAAILVDTGSCFHVACQSWKVKKDQSFLTTGGLSSMGYWAACLGACVATNKKDTIVITGDGSLQMNIQELATIKHNNLPIKLFVLNNNGYLLIRHTQRNFMDDRFVGESPATGVWCPDTIKIAEAYGIKSYKIECVENMHSVIKKVLKEKGPVVCEVMTPEWQLLIPRITSEKMPDGSLVAHEYEDMFPFLNRDELEMNMDMTDIKARR